MQPNTISQHWDEDADNVMPPCFYLPITANSIATTLLWPVGRWQKRGASQNSRSRVGKTGKRNEGRVFGIAMSLVLISVTILFVS